MIKVRLVRLLAGARRHVVHNIVWQLASLGAQVAVVFALTDVLDAMRSPGPTTAQQVRRAPAVLAAGIVMRYLCDVAASRASFQASVDVKCVLREHIYAKLLRLGASYKEHVGSAAITQLTTEGVDQLETYFGKYLPQFFYSLLAPAVLFAVLQGTCRRAAAVLLVCVPLMPAAIVAVQKVAKRLLSKYWGIYAGLGDSFLENLQGMTTLKIYKADEHKAEEMDRESEHFRKITMKVLTMQLNSTSVMDIVAYGGAAAGMVAAIREYLRGSVSFKDTMRICLLASEFFIPLRILGSYFHVAMNGMAASDKIFGLLDTPEPEQGVETLHEDKIDVELDNIGFSYDGERNVLTDVSFEIPCGKCVALVGESGCGKSTIANILAGTNKGYKGSIKICGRELSNINEESLSKCITLVRHDSYIFKGSVKENLLLAKPSASDEELEEALAMVNLLDYVTSMGGLTMQLAEAGSNLSGGQKQRLAIARALLHDTPMYIFDEAASNIDVESEEMIMKTINELAGKKTVLLISHRLSNVVSADNIILLDKGRAVEHGTHHELMEARGLYELLYKTQKSLEEYTSNSKKSTAAQVKILSTSLKSALSSNDKLLQEGDGEKYCGEKVRRRSGIRIMSMLIMLVKPLLQVMAAAILLGTVGFMCAISLTSIAAHFILTKKLVAWLLLGIAVSRGLLHYAEQYCNHFIAFKLLAIIRHVVFEKLRALCPAKLEGKDKGNLISIITTDIELLEVFYAHTISPISIAILTSLIMVLFISQHSYLAGMLALSGYIVVGLVIPLSIGKRNGEAGMKFRSDFGNLNSFVLESLRGLPEIIRYGQGERRKQLLTERSRQLNHMRGQLAEYEGKQKAVTNGMVLMFSYAMLLLTYIKYRRGEISFDSALMCTVAMMGSFGPVIALATLSNNLAHTLASGERVISLLEETPKVEEVYEAEDSTSHKGDKNSHAKLFDGASLDNVTFSYLHNQKILENTSLSIPAGKIVGIHGASGSGKSTILRLLMRFWDTDEGVVKVNERDVRKIPTSCLRDMESFMTQEAHLFHDSIANNIAIGKLDATKEEIVEASKLAAVHDFIETLPEGYDTEVGELGDTLSGGERQRIALARAFLHDGAFLLLDEPTSNLDALNEGIIIKSIKEGFQHKTVVLVSHRASTLNVADNIITIETDFSS